MNLTSNRLEALASLRNCVPTCWFNDGKRGDVTEGERARIAESAARLRRFAPLIATAFPETAGVGGRVESPLIRIAAHTSLIARSQPGRFFVKADHALPVGGSIKARGGANAVLSILEEVALRTGASADHMAVDLLRTQQILEKFQVSVGSTGNLGLSIGTYAARFGFKATVHMSNDAKLWKKNALRGRGVEVIEHAGDYLQAVAAGRDAAGDVNTFFIDDEASEELMYGYATAAAELHQQLRDNDIEIGPDCPLFIYLPCGVGGAPGGVTLGLNALYGGNVHCFFAEPVTAPCVLLDVLSDASQSRPRHVNELGLSGVTEADGLAVPRASEIASGIARRMAAGFYTVTDEALLSLVPRAYRSDGLRLEPSATAGFPGALLMGGTIGQQYLQSVRSSASIDSAVHVVWTTGGMLLPDNEFENFLRIGTTSSFNAI